MVPLNVFGSGMVRAASILSHCVLGNERVLLVDELENGLHHAAVRSLLQALLVLSRDRDMQVFATTHSLAVLERPARRFWERMGIPNIARRRTASRSSVTTRDACSPIGTSTSSSSTACDKASRSDEMDVVRRREV